MGLVKGDTRRLDCSSCTCLRSSPAHLLVVPCPWELLGVSPRNKIDTRQQLSHNLDS